MDSLPGKPARAGGLHGDPTGESRPPGTLCSHGHWRPAKAGLAGVVRRELEARSIAERRGESRLPDGGPAPPPSRKKQTRESGACGGDSRLQSSPLIDTGGADSRVPQAVEVTYTSSTPRVCLWSPSTPSGTAVEREKILAAFTPNASSSILLHYAY